MLPGNHAVGGGVQMPDFRHLLTPRQQKEYDRSNAKTAIPLRVSPRLRRATAALEEALAQGDRPRTEKICQAIADEICVALKVQPVDVRVREVRPSNRRGELHGLYVGGEAGQPDQVEVWMKTAKRAQVVKFRTFFRTLVHELCHHLDYELLKLEYSFHTDGFFKRESSLVRQILPSR